MEGKIDKPRRPQSISAFLRMLGIATTLIGGNAAAQNLPDFSGDMGAIGVLNATQGGIKSDLKRFLDANPRVLEEGNSKKIKQLFVGLGSAHDQIIAGTAFEKIDPKQGSYTMQYPDGKILRGSVISYNDWEKQGTNSWIPVKKYALVVPRKMALDHDTSPHGSKWIRHIDPKTKLELDVVIAPMGFEDAKDFHPIHLDSGVEPGDIAAVTSDNTNLHSVVIGPGYGGFQHVTVVPTQTNVGSALIKLRESGGTTLGAVLVDCDSVEVEGTRFTVARVVNANAISVILDTIRTKKPKDEGVPNPFN